MVYTIMMSPKNKLCSPGTGDGKNFTQKFIEPITNEETN